MKNNWQAVVLLFCIGLYIAYFTLASFLRYDNFYTGRFDLGNMDQAVWNTINGRIFQTNLNGEVVTRLTAHADFLLILLSPFYLIWSHPKMLLLIQTFALGVGAFFVYAIGRKILKNKNLSLLFALAYLLNPGVQYTNLYDFHAVTLATTFLLASFYFLLKNKYILLMVFLILAGLAKEHVWLICSLMGLYIFSINKNSSYKKLGILIFIVSAFLFYYLVWHAIPNASGTEHFALSYYSDFGDSPTRIVKNFFLSPQKIVETMLTANRLIYLQQLFYPLGSLSLFSPFFLIFALPDLFINLLSNNSNLHQIYYQYSATITPFIFVSAIYGIKNFMKFFPKIPTIFYFLYLIIVALLSSYFFGPLPLSKNPNIDMFTKPQEKRIVIENFLSSIPEQYSVAATNNLGSHISHRRIIYTVPVGIDKADIVMFLRSDRKMVDNMKHDKNYAEVLKIDNFVVFKKRGNLL